MAEPGGILQWDELDTASFNSHAPNASISKRSADELLDLWQGMCVKSGLKFDWISELASIFTAHGLALLDSSRLPISNDLRKASTDDWLSGLEDIGYVVTSRGGIANPLGTLKEFRELFNKMVKETQQGVSISMDMIVVVGRKEV
ncbi:MAG: hypothetical protein Q9187_006041 [Circinaria calcarea]